jgi:molybdopterin-binding protein
MRTSARNSLPGIIRKIELGSVNAEVTLEIAPGIEIVSIITVHAVENLGLKQGKKAFAVIKASSVMVGVD